MKGLRMDWLGRSRSLTEPVHVPDGRFVKVCYDHGVPLDQGSLACPQEHPAGETLLWFVWDLEKRVVEGGICTQEDGDTGAKVEEERITALRLRTVAPRNTVFHDVTRQEEQMGKMGVPLTEEQKAEIVKNHDPGKPHTEQAVKVGISQSTYSRILRESGGGAKSKPRPRKSKPKKARVAKASAPAYGEHSDVCQALISERDRLQVQLAAIDQALEALR